MTGAADTGTVGALVAAQLYWPAGGREAANVADRGRVGAATPVVATISAAIPIQARARTARWFPIAPGVHSFVRSTSLYAFVGRTITTRCPDL
jgi:hypothetical protein